jgi:hypothetical protein
MQGQDVGTGGERTARAQREDGVERREERRLDGDSSKAEDGQRPGGGKATAGEAAGTFGLDRELSRLPKAKRDRIVRGSLKAR